MRFGCGCFVGLVLVIAVLAGLGWAIHLIFEPIEAVTTTPTVEDGRRAQQKVFEIIRRRGDPKGKPRDPVILTQAELNALVTHHLVQAGELPLEGLSIHLPARDRAEFSGRVPLGALLAERPVSSLRGIIPAKWLEQRVGLRVNGRARVEPGNRGRRHLRIEVREFTLGGLRLPAFAARVLLDPSTVGLLRWRLPSGVEDVTIEPGRAVVRVAS